MTANRPPEHYLSCFDRAAGNALEALQKPHPFRLMTGRFNLHACSNRTNVDRPALVLSQCKGFLSVSNTTLFIMFSMERQFDVGLSEQLPKNCRGRATRVLAGRNGRNCIVNHAERFSLCDWRRNYRHCCVWRSVVAAQPRLCKAQRRRASLANPSLKMQEQAPCLGRAA